MEDGRSFASRFFASRCCPGPAVFSSKAAGGTTGQVTSEADLFTHWLVSIFQLPLLALPKYVVLSSGTHQQKLTGNQSKAIRSGLGVRWSINVEGERRMVVKVCVCHTILNWAYSELQRVWNVLTQQPWGIAAEAKWSVWNRLDSDAMLWQGAYLLLCWWRWFPCIKLL